MQDFDAKLALWLKKYEKIAVLSGILVVFAVLATACLWKYGIFGYRGFDLAYFSQVFWNTVHGRLFEQSLHPHLSLGDHAELAILPLAPLFALWQDPRMLLLMQAAVLAACAWPVWRIAKFRLAAAGARSSTDVADDSVSSSWMAALPLAAAAAMLLNASLHNIALFEFHVLAFACFPLLMAVLAYEIGNRRAFVLWCLAALLVREDVSFVVFMFGAMAWLEGKSKWWRWTPALLGAAWFLGAILLVRHFAPAGSYKFSIYYAWLGETPWQMLTFPIRHPLQFVRHFVTFGNLEMLLGLLMPFAFLPLLKPRRLLLALGPLAMILLGAAGGSEVVVQTHYAVLFLPALALAAIDGLAAAPAFVRARWRDLRFMDSSALVGVTLLGCALYGAVVLGPLPAVAKRAAADTDARVRASEYRALLAQVPDDASVAASYALLPALSTRQELTSLHYVALGVTQFAERPYLPPDSLRFVALDAEDLLLYDAQFAATSWAAPHYAGSLERLKAQMGVPVFAEAGLALYDREALSFGVEFPLTAPDATGSDADGIAVAAQLIEASNDRAARLAVVANLGWWKVPAGSAVRYLVKDADGVTVLDRRLPIDAPLPWTSRNGGVTLRFVAVAPAEGVAPYRVEVLIEDITGHNVLNGVRGTGLLVTKAEVLRRGDSEVR